MRTVDEPVPVGLARADAPTLTERPRLVANAGLDECGRNRAKVIAVSAGMLIVALDPNVSTWHVDLARRRISRPHAIAGQPYDPLCEPLLWVVR